MQEESRLNEERIRVALVVDSVMVFNQDNVLRYTWIHNPGVQFSVEEILGKTDADLFSEEEAANLMAIKRQVLASGKRVRQEIQTTIDGKPHFYDLNVEPLHDVGGNIIGITGAMMDISGRRTGKPEGARGA